MVSDNSDLAKKRAEKLAKREEKKMFEEKKRAEKLAKREEKKMLEEKKRRDREEKREERKFLAEKKRLELKNGALNHTKFERQFVSKINSMFTGPADFIITDHGNNKSALIKNVVRFRKIEGSKSASPLAYANRDHNTPKADIAAVDSDGKDVAWISHKAKPPSPSQFGFNQYLRISGKKLQFTGSALEEVNNFKRNLVKYAPPNKEWPQGKTMWAPIKSDLVKNQAVFGFNYGKNLDRDNVTVFGQGDPELERMADGVINLRFSVHSALNGHLELLKDKYTPVFYARSERSKSGRRKVTAVVNGVEYKYLVMFIQPYNAVSKKTILVSNSGTPIPRTLSSTSSRTVSLPSSPLRTVSSTSSRTVTLSPQSSPYGMSSRSPLSVSSRSPLSLSPWSRSPMSSPMSSPTSYLTPSRKTPTKTITPKKTPVKSNVVNTNVMYVTYANTKNPKKILFDTSKRRYFYMGKDGKKQPLLFSSLNTNTKNRLTRFERSL